METESLLKEYSETGAKQKAAAQYILRQNPMKYESEYDSSLPYWTDEQLMDFFIRKLKFYKMFSLGNVMTRYNGFYQFCVECGLIKSNPFYKSMYLSYDYLTRMAVEADNVPFYLRERVKEICLKSQNTDYFLSVALAVYEGVKGYKELADIKLKQIDFADCSIEGYRQHFSEELMQEFKKLHEMKYYKTYRNCQQFDDSQGYLIRRIVANGKTQSESPSVRNMISNKMQRLGLEQAALYDSGLINRLCGRLGKKEFLDYFFYDMAAGKAEKTARNQTLKKVLEELDCDMSVKNFLYDYRVYALLLKYES